MDGPIQDWDNTSWTTSPCWSHMSPATRRLQGWLPSMPRPSTVTVPRSLDGFARSSSEFVPATLICLRGPSHGAGHYFVILIYRDLMWIADDGQPPMHLDHLTPQLASQVTQIWAVHIDSFRTMQQVIRSACAAAQQITLWQRDELWPSGD